MHILRGYRNYFCIDLWIWYISLLILQYIWCEWLKRIYLFQVAITGISLLSLLLKCRSILLCCWYIYAYTHCVVWFIHNFSATIHPIGRWNWVARFKHNGGCRCGLAGVLTTVDWDKQVHANMARDFIELGLVGIGHQFLSASPFID